MKGSCQEDRRTVAPARFYRWKQIGAVSHLCVAFSAVTGWRGVRQADESWWRSRLRQGEYQRHRRQFARPSGRYLLKCEVKTATGEWIALDVIGRPLHDETGQRIGNQGFVRVDERATVHGLPRAHAAHVPRDPQWRGVGDEGPGLWEDEEPHRGPLRAK